MPVECRHLRGLRARLEHRGEEAAPGARRFRSEAPVFIETLARRGYRFIGHAGGAKAVRMCRHRAAAEGQRRSRHRCAPGWHWEPPVVAGGGRRSWYSSWPSLSWGLPKRDSGRRPSKGVGATATPSWRCSRSSVDGGPGRPGSSSHRSSQTRSPPGWPTSGDRRPPHVGGPALLGLVGDPGASPQPWVGMTRCLGRSSCGTSISGDRAARRADGVAVWGRHLRGAERSALLDLQDRVAEQVVAALRIELAGPDRARLHTRYTDNPAAYDFYPARPRASC